MPVGREEGALFSRPGATILRDDVIDGLMAESLETSRRVDKKPLCTSFVEYLPKPEISAFKKLIICFLCYSLFPLFTPTFKALRNWQVQAVRVNKYGTVTQRANVIWLWIIHISSTWKIPVNSTTDESLFSGSRMASSFFLSAPKCFYETKASKAVKI